MLHYRGRVGVLLSTSVPAAMGISGTTAVTLYFNPAHEAFVVQVLGLAGATTAMGRQVGA